MSPTRRSFLRTVAALPVGVVAARSFAPPSPGGETRLVTDTNDITNDITDAIALDAAPAVFADCDLEPAGFAPMPVGNTGYAGLPTITRVPPSRLEPHRPGPLRLVWFAGINHTSYGTAMLMTSLSHDDGVTWSPPFTYAWSNSLRDPGLSTHGDRVRLSYFTGTTVSPALGVYVRESRDGGATFGTPRRVDPNLSYAASSAPPRGIGDRMLMPWYGRYPGQNRDSAVVSVLPHGTNQWTAWVVADGQADDRDYSEPWLLVDDDPVSTRMRVFHRYGGRDRIGLSESLDGGQTWATRPLFVGWGKPAAVRMSTGQLVVIYRSIVDSAAVYAVSSDDGVTWDHGRPLLANTAGTTLGMIYAAPYEISPGRLYVVVAMETAGGAGCRLHHGHLACG